MPSHPSISSFFSSDIPDSSLGGCTTLICNRNCKVLRTPVAPHHGRLNQRRARTDKPCAFGHSEGQWTNPRHGTNPVTNMHHRSHVQPRPEVRSMVPPIACPTCTHVGSFTFMRDPHQRSLLDARPRYHARIRIAGNRARSSAWPSWISHSSSSVGTRPSKMVPYRDPTRRRSDPVVARKVFSKVDRRGP